MMQWIRLVAGAAGVAALLAGCATVAPDESPMRAAVQPTRDDARALAVEVYTYAYPLVLTDVTREVMAARASAGAAGQTAVNTFVHQRGAPRPGASDMPSPDADTLTSVAWLDLSRGPVVLSVPDTQGRYYTLQLMDGWSNVFSALGKRTTGTQRGNYAIVGPDWTGALPAGVREIRSPTAMAWAAVHIQVDGKRDLPAVHRLQNGYRLTPLAAWPNGRRALPAVPTIPPAAVDLETPPVEQVAAMDAQAFFHRFAALLPANPPSAADEGMMQKVRALGIEPGAPYSTTVLEPETARALQDGATRALARIVTLARGGEGAASGAWLSRKDAGRYGTDYDRRAATAWLALGSSLGEDTMVFRANADASGQPLQGGHRYVIRFDKSALPPARAFWSLSLYDQAQDVVANPLNRYAIGSRDGLRRNRDGSIEIVVQQARPPRAQAANWLPAPDGPFNLMLRLYWPQPTALDGGWSPPSVRRIGAN